MQFYTDVKSADPGDSFSTRTDSASTFSQSTAASREQKSISNTGNSHTGGKTQDATSTVKVNLDKSGIDEKIQDECRQVIIIFSLGLEGLWWREKGECNAKRIEKRESMSMVPTAVD